ncbi:hypothetical protein FQA39_LY01781 [Lamprigera yunnana]|nr:hypothetical protein FQA39_LY01781 [Lamprigera yunnana]
MGSCSIQKGRQGVESEKFHINSSYKEFIDRQKNVFDQLGALESSSRDSLSKNDTQMDLEEPLDLHIEVDRISSKSSLRQLQGTESLFKKPQPRPLKHIKYLLNRKVPDYQINPHKWTRYNLDVPQEDMTERANANAALSLLKQLEKRNQIADENVTETNTRIMFKKMIPKVDREEQASVSFRSSKVIMPEYVVGQKTKMVKPKSTVITSNRKEIKLDHINQFDDGDENENDDI